MGLKAYALIAWIKHDLLILRKCGKNSYKCGKCSIKNSTKKEHVCIRVWLAKNRTFFDIKMSKNMCKKDTHSVPKKKQNSQKEK